MESIVVRGKACLRCVILLASLSSGHAFAGIIDNSTYTTDTLSGLDWLDVTASMYMSHNQVTAEFIDGGMFEGWRYATGREFNTLVSNYLGLESPITTYGAVEVAEPGIDGLISMLGDTYNAAILRNHGIENHVREGVEDGLDYGYTHGLLADRSSDVIFTAYYSAALEDNAESDPAPDNSIGHNTFVRDRLQLNAGGSFLVRSSSIQPVSEPPILVLFALALLVANFSIFKASNTRPNMP